MWSKYQAQNIAKSRNNKCGLILRLRVLQSRVTTNVDNSQAQSIAKSSNNKCVVSLRLRVLQSLDGPYLITNSRAKF